MEKKKLLLVSGGLDSTVLAYKMKRNNENFEALTIKTDSIIGDLEEKKSRFFMDDINVNLHILDLSSSMKNFIGIYIPDLPPITTFRWPDDIWQKSSLAGDSAGTLFGLTSAAVYALQHGFSGIVYGVHSDDRAQFSENNREYFDMLAKLISIETGKEFNIETPFIELTKAEIIDLGMRLGVNLSQTHSCSHKVQCGECHACQERIKAFSKSNVHDMTTYESGKISLSAKTKEKNKIRRK